MAGMDHILSKGFVVASSVTSPIALGNPLVLAANTTVSFGQAAQVTLPGLGSAAGSVFCIGVAQENVDLVKAQTGKAFIAVGIMGVTKVIADGAIPIGDYVGQSHTTIGQVHDLGATAGAGHFSIGIALEAAVNAGDIIDVLLTPGGLTT